MALITSAASGPWSSTSTWTGGVIPGNGDQADINGHAVTVADSRTIGRSGVAGTIDVRVMGGGSLTVLNGGTLRCRGDLSVNGGVYRVEGGGTHLYDATQAAAPTTTVYEIRWDSEGAGTRVEFIGTSNALRAVIDSDVTGGAAGGRMNGQAGLDVMHLTFQWARLRNMDLAFAINSAGYGTRQFHLIDSIVEASVGRIVIGGNAGSDVQVDRSFVADNANRFELIGGPTRDAGKTFMVRDSTILSDFWTNAGGIHISGTYFRSLFNSDDTQSCAVWENNFIEKGGDGGAALLMFEPATGAVLGRTYMLHVNPAATNPHWVGFRGAIPGRVIKMLGWIFEAVSPDSDAGDIVFGPSIATCTVELEQCMTLPNPAGRTPGCLVNKTGAGTLRIRHCTIFGNGNLSGLYLDEATPSAANTVPEFEDCILWSTSPVAAALVWRESSSTATSGVGSGWGSNLFWNILNWSSAENPKLGYNGGAAGALVSGTLAGLTTDLNSTNPQFVAPTRNLVAFARTVGGYSGTDDVVRAALIAALRARPNPADAAYNAAVSISALLNWIEGGFAPQNGAVQSASDALVGGWRGAVQGISQTLAPDGTTANASWSAVGAASLHAALAAGDSDYITSGTDLAQADLTLQNPDPPLASIDTATLRVRLRAASLS